MNGGRRIKVVDLFAGPGGLGEGFSALRDRQGERVFKLALSIEKDTDAYKTLLLRAFVRHFPDGKWPKEYYEQLRSGKINWNLLFKAYASQARMARQEVWNAELGHKRFPPEKIDMRIKKAIGSESLWVLIGGPPCQVYSLVGRSRIRGESRWHFARDERHLLYKEYLRIIGIHRPPVFVMENVKGLLSSKKAGKKIIEQIVKDLCSPLGDGQQPENNYTLYALADYSKQECNGRTSQGSPAQYIIKCENHGIPQARHRLIMLGVRNDIEFRPEKLIVNTRPVRMWKAISDLPALRSRLSTGSDSKSEWISAVKAVLASKTWGYPKYQKVYALMERLASKLVRRRTGGEFVKSGGGPTWQRAWLHDAQLSGVCNHSSRSHIRKDLWRYYYAACFAQLNERSAVLRDFPRFLLPAHKNVRKKASKLDQHFADRFRVQLKHRPSTTVTSHIGKDGHYFIHPDPIQCRSLTVREAARLQTFPDNYFFTGNRTAQYQQVGNAVPPLLARQIAVVVADLLNRSGGGVR